MKDYKNDDKYTLDNICYVCGNYGHMMDICPHRYCVHCNIEGHNLYQCDRDRRP